MANIGYMQLVRHCNQYCRFCSNPETPYVLDMETELADRSTETRKLIEGEERIVHFLDEKGTVRQTDFRHPKAEACRHCTLNEIYGGLFELGDHYDLAELAPVFVRRSRLWRASSRTLEERCGHE